MVKQRDIILNRFDSLRFARASHEIVKYRPEFYDEKGHYQKDEWTSFSDVGKEYEGRIVTMEEYLEIENRFISITHVILEEAGCKYVTLGYIENSRRKKVKEGMRVSTSEIDYYLRLALRGKVFIVFINSSKGIQFDWSEDYLYMHLYCRIPEDRLREIVESRGLYLDPRSKDNVDRYWYHEEQLYH
jgi:hypothetical protein